jgi:hypothetical protein
MADRVLFIGWNRPVVGREQQAMELWQKAMEYYGKLQADGRIESFEPVILTAHGGDLNGFVMLRGGAEKLAESWRKLGEMIPLSISLLRQDTACKGLEWSLAMSVKV